MGYAEDNAELHIAQIRREWGGRDMAKEVKFEIPLDAKSSVCRDCKATIYWIRTVKGLSMPVNPDGVSHFATCPAAGKFRGTGKKAASSDPGALK